jgi:hypothetical protein
MDKKSFLKILGEKYKHFRCHLVHSRHFDFSGLATNFLLQNSIRRLTYPKTKTFH